MDASRPMARIWLATLVLAYLVTFRLIYGGVFMETFKYMGFEDTPATLEVLALPWCLALLPVALLPRRLAGPSFVVLWYLYLLAYIPIMTVPFYGGVIRRVPYEAFAMILAFGFCLAILIITCLPHRGLPVAPGPRALPVFLGTLTLATFGGLLLFTGIRPDLSRLTDVYGLRGDYTAQLAQSGRWVKYLVPWQINLVGPALLALGLVRKRPLFFLVGALGQAGVFLIAGFKSALLAIPLVCLLHLGLRAAQGRKFPLRANLFILGLLLAGVAEKALWNTPFIMGFFQQRAMAMPGLLTGQYFEFYATHAKAHLGYGLLKGLTGYPYLVEPSQVIGTLDPTNPTVYANANIWADAFANFGLPAVLAVSLLLGLVLWAMDHMAQGKDPLLAALLAAMPAMVMGNASFPTSLLTGGVALSILAIALLPPQAPGASHPSAC